jgi:hypothetical protein
LSLGGLTAVSWPHVVYEYQKGNLISKVGGSAILDLAQRYKKEAEARGENLEILKLLLAKRDQLMRVTSMFEQLTGREDVAQRLAIDAQIAEELKALIGNLQAVAMPAGEALVVRTYPNTFRILFPVPMRASPEFACPPEVLPAGTTYAAIDKSPIAATVIFTPPTIRVERVPPGCFFSAQL